MNSGLLLDASGRAMLTQPGLGQVSDGDPSDCCGCGDSGCVCQGKKILGYNVTVNVGSLVSSDLLSQIQELAYSDPTSLYSGKTFFVPLYAQFIDGFVCPGQYTFLSPVTSFVCYQVPDTNTYHLNPAEDGSDNGPFNGTAQYSIEIEATLVNVVFKITIGLDFAFPNGVPVWTESLPASVQQSIFLVQPFATSLCQNGSYLYDNLFPASPTSNFDPDGSITVELVYES